MATYNNFNKDKNFTEVIFQAGKPIQSAELNELQSIQVVVPLNNKQLCTKQSRVVLQDQVTRCMSSV
jgi:homoserine kinase